MARAPELRAGARGQGQGGPPVPRVRRDLQRRDAGARVEGGRLQAAHHRPGAVVPAAEERTGAVREVDAAEDEEQGQPPPPPPLPHPMCVDA